MFYVTLRHSASCDYFQSLLSYQNLCDIYVDCIAGAVKADIRFIAFHNEQSACYAASAYGYLTSKLGILLTVSGPGCVHGLADLNNAMINTWPMIMVSGSCDQADFRKGDFQELDQLKAVQPFVKFSGKDAKASQIPSLDSQALNAAAHGRPGGCYLDFPTDVLHENIDKLEADRLLAEVCPFQPIWALPKLSTVEFCAPEQDIQTAVSMLRQAQRLLIVICKGAAYARAEGPLVDFVKLTGIPFLPTPMGKGLLSDTHELSATAARSLAIEQCDVALVVGARLNWMLHFGECPRWAADVNFILVDVSKDEIEPRNPALGLVGDARLVLQQITREIKDDPFCLGRNHPWVERIVHKASENVKKMSAFLAKYVVPFNFQTPMRIIRDMMLAQGSFAPVVVSEGANTMDVGWSVLIQTEPRTRLDAGTWGTMGVGLGYCIAAAMAYPERLIVVVEGDSGFGFNGLEVETLVRYKLLVIVIIFNQLLCGRSSWKLSELSRNCSRQDGVFKRHRERCRWIVLCWMI